MDHGAAAVINALAVLVTALSTAYATYKGLQMKAKEKAQKTPKEGDEHGRDGEGDLEQ